MPTTTTTATTTDPDGYVLGRTASEYGRLRAQARAWEPATARLLDQVGVAPGARCLDAGCGPGETMRLLATRAGPGGAVVGIDVDERLGAQAVDALHAAGHAQCAFAAVDVTSPAPIPGAPFDLVFARLLLMHLPDPTAVLARLWSAVGPGGHLVVQDFDLRSVSPTPALDSVAEFRRVVLGTFAAAGRHVDLGPHPPSLFGEADIGAPDGTDVTGRLEPLATAGPGIAAVWDSARPAAVAHGLIAEDAAARWREAFARDTAGHPDHMLLWPLLVGAWKRRAS